MFARVTGLLDRGVNVIAIVPYAAVRGTTLLTASRVPVWRALDRELREVAAEAAAHPGLPTLDELRVMDHIEQHKHRIEKHVALAPAVENWLYKVRYGNPVSDTIAESRWAAQRVLRGWDDRATWSLDVYLFRTVGQQLHHLADTTHGWPGGLTDESGVLLYPEFEDWQATLRFHGDRLVAAADWFALSDADKDTTLDAAQESLRWVADNVGSLWD